MSCILLCYYLASLKECSPESGGMISYLKWNSNLCCCFMMSWLCRYRPSYRKESHQALRVRFRRRRVAWRSSVDTAASWGLEVQTEWCSAPRTCVHRSPKGSRSFLSTQSESKIQRCNWTVSKNGSAHRNQLQLSGRLLLSSRIDTTPPVWETWTHPYIVCCGVRGDGFLGSGSEPLPHQLGGCLLYTSDAADE